MASARSGTVPYWRWPELASDDQVVGGVSAGLGRELGVSANWVRLAFVALFASGGWGALLYGTAWVAMALHTSAHDGPLPDEGRVAKGRTSQQRHAGFGLLILGMVILSLQIGGFPTSIVVTLGLLGTGTLLSWTHLSNRSTDPGGRARRVLLVSAGLIMITAALVVLSTETTGATDTSGGIR
ncbi:MAG: PspC domain-containing protein [Actinomycetia bacterium]|nr:PspC domain-containing protein [Actinomycetes bacterium]